MTTYVVTAYRWGLRDNHSYVVGSYTDINVAKRIADEHVTYRGNKYGCEIVKCDTENEYEGGNDSETVYYAECPYFGNGIGMRSRRPVDGNRWLEVQTILQKIEERKWANSQLNKMHLE